MRKIIHAFLLLKRHLAGQLEVKEIQVVKRFISPDHNCIDIGAHGGSWSRPLSSIVSKGKVYSFEALPYYADVLRILFRLLFIRNVEIINKAVSNSDNEISIAWKDDSGKRLTGKTHILGKDEKASYLISVKAITLDAFMKETQPSKVDFLKIDVEGAELYVFEGAVNFLAQHTPVIYCEVDARWTVRYGYQPENVFDFLYKQGYDSFLIDKQGELQKIDQNSYSKKGDVLFIHKTNPSINKK